MGWLSKGHTVEMNRSKLVGEYIGHTEAKTTQAIEDARGGVLFIDEAYALVQPVGANNDFGREVLNALMTVLSEPNPDMIIILAGYEDRMEQMLESNAGLRDRFPLTLHFDDFTADELLQMAENLAHGQGFVFAPEAKERLQGMIERAVRARDPHFGNGRWLHNLMEHGILKAMAERVMNTPASTDERLLLTRIEEADVLSADELWLSQRTTLRPARCRVGF
jgi:stage V sporulation protein K